MTHYFWSIVSAEYSYIETKLREIFWKSKAVIYRNLFVSKVAAQKLLNSSCC